MSSIHHTRVQKGLKYRVCLTSLTYFTLPYALLGYVVSKNVKIKNSKNMFQHVIHACLEHKNRSKSKIEISCSDSPETCLTCIGMR